MRPDGTMEGFDIDLAAATCERLKVSCEWVRQDFDGIIPALQQGKFDIIFDLLSITPKRTAVVDFAIPIAINRQGFMVLKSSPLAAEAASEGVVSLDDAGAFQPLLERFRRALAGKTIGTDIATPRAELSHPVFQGRHCSYLSERARPAP
jgi:octopine/nopaline transport system substrate-binding protein